MAMLNKQRVTISTRSLPDPDLNDLMTIFSDPS